MLTEAGPPDDVRVTAASAQALGYPGGMALATVPLFYWAQVKALYDYDAQADGELSMKVPTLKHRPQSHSPQEGEMIFVTKQDDSGWWQGEKGGVSGWFPSNYVEKI